MEDDPREEWGGTSMNVMMPNTSSSSVSSLCERETMAGIFGESISGVIKIEGKVVSSRSGKEESERAEEEPEVSGPASRIEVVGVDCSPTLFS